MFVLIHLIKIETLRKLHKKMEVSKNSFKIHKILFSPHEQHAPPSLSDTTIFLDHPQVKLSQA